MCDIPLTLEQKIFASQNHDLVYKFLNEKHLSEEEFYDIIVFGYLRSVHRFFSEPNLQQYSFGTIAWKGMQGSLNDYRKSKSYHKNNIEVLSIHSDLHDDGNFAHKNSSAYNDLIAQLEINLLLHDLAKRVSKQQMDIVRMKSNGFNLQDIATQQNTSIKRIRRLLEEVRVVLMELCNE